MESNRANTFRVKAKSFFLTYSQCPISREQALEDLKTRFHDDLPHRLHRIAISRENHQDGNHHLHIMMYLAQQIQTRDARFLDLLDEDNINYHPNISTTIRSGPRAYKYITKEDPTPLEWPDEWCKEEFRAREGKTAILGKRMMTGESLAAIAEDHPEILMNFVKLQ